MSSRLTKQQIEGLLKFEYPPDRVHSLISGLLRRHQRREIDLRSFGTSPESLKELRRVYAERWASTSVRLVKRSGNTDRARIIATEIHRLIGAKEIDPRRLAARKATHTEVASFLAEHGLRQPTLEQVT